jgi:integrase
MNLPETAPERDRVDDRVTPMSWKTFRADFEASQSLNARTTRAKSKQVLDAVEALGIASTTDLTVPFVVRFVQSRPADLSPYTLHGLLGALRTVCSYAEQIGAIRTSPFRIKPLRRWVRLPALDGDDRHCPREAIRRVLDLLANDIETLQGWAQWRARRLQAVIALAAYLGLRKNEILRALVTAVDLDNRVFHVRPPVGGKLKTARSQAPVPIPAALVPILQSWLAHRMDAPHGHPLPDSCDCLIPTNNRKAPWTSGAPGGKALDRLQAIAKRAGIKEGMTFQMLRRSCATHLEHQGLGEALIARILRHTPRVSAKHYRRADIANLVSATDTFDF